MKVMAEISHHESKILYRKLSRACTLQYKVHTFVEDSWFFSCFFLCKSGEITCFKSKQGLEK